MAKFDDLYQDIHQTTPEVGHARTHDIPKVSGSRKSHVTIDTKTNYD